MAVMEWKQVKPDFSSSNNSMQNAMSGLSTAGTVFDKLRQSILDEEQRALDNAYKQQTFDENVRQFELQQAFNEEKFNEDIRQFNAKQQWERENAAAEREFKAKENLLAHQRAAALKELGHRLTTEAGDAKTAGYNALNTYFLDDYKKHGNLQKAAENVRAFANANYPNLLFDEGRVFGNLADAVAASYLPDARALQDWNTVKQGVIAGGERVGYDKNLQDNFSHMAVINGKVFQEVNGTMYPVPDSEAQELLRLQEEREWFRKLEQQGYNILANKGMDPQQSTRLLNKVGSQSAIDQRDALLEFVSRYGVVNPSSIPAFKTVIDAGEAAEANIAAEDKARKEREKQYTPDAYNKVYSEVYKGAVDAGNDVFNVSKNPKLNASIKLLDEAMRKAQVPASEFKILLEQLRDHDYSWLKIKNDDITSEELNNPVLKAYKDKYLPNLGKPETEEKPKTPATATTSGSTKNNPNSTKPPLTEKLESIDTKSAPVVIKALEGYYQQLKNVSNSSVASTVDQETLRDRMTKLSAAIDSLKKGTPIVVSDREFYEYLRKAINSATFNEVTSDEQGNAVFTQVPDLSTRFLRLSEEAAKTGK